MRATQFFTSLLLLNVILLNIGLISPALAQVAVVNAVLFYSPTCPHCHKVIQEDLPPLIDKYAGQLQIIGVNTANPQGQTLFQAAVQQFNIPQDRQVVPMLIVGETVLAGSLEIPQQLPGLVDEFLAQGGVSWPAIPSLAEALAAAENQTNLDPDSSTPTSTLDPSTTLAIGEPPTATLPSNATQTMIPANPTSTPSGSGLILSDDPPSGIWEGLARDAAGNALALIVLVGMLISLVWGVLLLRPAHHLSNSNHWSWMVPVLVVIGLVVAGYLSYIETTHSTAVCGPVGDCNTVQQSQYARFFGVFPIGVLGMFGYVAILVAWFLSRLNHGQLAKFASLALLGMAFFGTLFSIYLTFLEPFVIGATCAWCLTSAVIMTALFWLSLVPGKAALKSLLNQ